MLNDLKDWAAEKGENSKDFAQDVATEVTSTSAMDWSGSVWIAIAAIVVFAIFGLISAARD